MPNADHSEDEENPKKQNAASDADATPANETSHTDAASQDGVDSITERWSEPVTGLVISSVGMEANVELPRFGVLRCVQPRDRAFAIVGDRVDVVWTPDRTKPDIVEVHERRSSLSRYNPRDRAVQELAANIDRLVVVVAIEPPPRLGLIDRYLAVAEWQGIRGVVVLNKSDLPGSEPIAERLKLYEECDCDVVVVSAHDGRGLERLRAMLSTGTSVLAGHSGVGKSSVIRALLPEHEIEVGDISKSSGRGKHTTTTAVAYRLGEGLVIDTPGVREFALGDIEPDMLRECYHDLDRVADDCKFANCLHLGEPGCAVAAAVKEGRIDPDRHESYKHLYEELSDLAKKNAYKSPSGRTGYGTSRKG